MNSCLTVIITAKGSDTRWAATMYEIDQLVDKVLRDHGSSDPSTDKFEILFVGGSSYNSPIGPQFCFVIDGPEELLTRLGQSIFDFTKPYPYHVSVRVCENEIRN